MDTKKPIDTLTLIIKLTAVTTIVTAVFGVGYQKGMIIQMGLGNLSGNYELREIFNSSILGYLHIFNSVVSVEKGPLATGLLSLGITLVAVFALLGLTLTLFTEVDKEKLQKKRKKTRRMMRKRFNSISTRPLAFIFYPIFGGLFGALLSISTVVIGYMSVIASAALIMFPLLGYLTGAGKIHSEIKKPSCVTLSEESLQSSDIAQCTQILINGKRITGEVLLENSGGYFIKRNSAFAFISKDGKRCVFRKYYTKARNNYAKVEDINFKELDKELDSFCDPKPIAKKVKTTL